MKTYKKIDVYYAGEYLYSTNRYKLCKDARAAYLFQLEGYKHQLGGLTFFEKTVLEHSQYLTAKKSTAR